MGLPSASSHCSPGSGEIGVTREGENARYCFDVFGGRFGQDAAQARAPRRRGGGAAARTSGSAGARWSSSSRRGGRGSASRYDQATAARPRRQPFASAADDQVMRVILHRRGAASSRSSSRASASRRGVRCAFCACASGSPSGRGARAASRRRGFLEWSTGTCASSVAIWCSTPTSPPRAAARTGH
jgi:hypothetical protein